MSSTRHDLDLSPAVHQALADADRLPEIVVLLDPGPEVLEAYALEDRIGVLAVVPGGAEARADALAAGALEVLDPALPEVEVLQRLETAVARFRSRLRLERSRDALDRQTAGLERDLRLAAKLQRSFLPPVLPEDGRYRFSAAYLPRDYVSGDSYHVEVRGEQVLFYTFDAVGHGVRAALLTVLLRSLFRPVDEDGLLRPPHEVLEELDRGLREAHLDESPTAAFCYGVLDRSRGVLTVANAGHPLPVRLRGRSGGDPIGSSGLLLGVQPETYETAEIALEPGDRVFFFTDGVGPDYGERFVAQLRLHGDLDLEDQVGGALGAVVILDEEGRPEDDVAVLALEARRPAGTGAGEPAEGRET